ncbi:MAG: class I tRNA ligase family protein, partial [Proteobacteria bacterium]|nr:class I tRNA ligase family protein [Pseudomonadota bacterium]
APPPDTAPPADDGAAAALRAATHRTIASVTADVERFRFNVAVARVHEYANVLGDAVAAGPSDPAAAWALREGLETLALLIGPMMPHLAEEGWERLGGIGLLAEAAWPVHDPTRVREDTVTVRIQVNGKLRGTMDVPAGLPEASLRERALGEVDAQERIANAIAGKPIRKIVVVPDRIVSFVV